MGYYAERNAEADALLARLTDDQLRAGLERGRRMLATTKADEFVQQEAVHDSIGHPSQHASKQFAAFMDEDSQYRIRALNSAITDTLKEMDRRGIDPADRTKEGTDQ